jgi:cytochrome P450
MADIYSQLLVQTFLSCNLLLVAGNLTTTDLIGNGVLALLSYPDQLAKLRAHPELAPHAVEEMLRYDPPVAQTSRVALDSLEIGGTEVQVGEVMTVSILAAGRDPARYAEPHRFNIERPDTSHLAFGGGAHFCLGAPLARAEAQIAIPLLFERFPRLRLDPQHPIEHKGAPVFNGLTALRVRSA